MKDIMDYYDYYTRPALLSNITKDILLENKDAFFSMLLNNYKIIITLLESDIYNLPFDEQLMENIYDNINKNVLIRTKKIPFEFIQKHIEDFDINDILHYQQCPMEFLENYVDNYHYMTFISNDQQLSEEFILKHKDDLIWSLLSGQQWLYEYDKKFLKKINKYIDWEIATQNCIINVNKLLKINKKLDWRHITEEYDLNMNFIEKNIKYMNINILIQRYTIPEFLLEKYNKNINADIFSRYYPVTKLSKEFIEKYKNLFKWDIIAGNNKSLNLEFISDYLMDYDLLIEENRYIDNSIKKQIKNLKRL